MPSLARRCACLSMYLLAAALVSGCGGLDRVSSGITGMVSPYRADVIQGNFISKEQVEALRPGMSRQQVAELLGTPLLVSVFHADRWEYAFTLKSQQTEPIGRKLTVYFKADQLERFEGDEMLSEADFAAKFTPPKGKSAVPVLEASEDALKAFPKPERKAETTAAAPAARATAYPPLEPAPR